MKKNISGLLSGALLVVIGFTALSCKKTFDIEPTSAIAYNQMYRNIYDADAAVIGIYGKFLALAPRYVILNELRADLADVTANSDKYLVQLNNHSVTEDNPYADPRPFYEVINYCNDALKNFSIMYAEHKMDETQYKQRYSDIGMLRSWLYLQLGIHWGNIPYITEPIEALNDISDETKFVKIPFNQLLDQLIAFCEALPYKGDYPAGITLPANIDTYSTSKFFINKKCFLGDLYLWKGNYTQAAINYKYVMTYYASTYDNNSEQYFDVYKVNYDYNTGGNWRNIFMQAYGERYSNYEIIWDLPYDKNFSPTNPFIDLFLTSGKYVMKPSAYVINNWNLQMRTDNTPTDIRGLNISYRFEGANPVINKFTYNYSSSLPFETTSKIIYYRAAQLHLRFAEAANQDGKNKVAYALVNYGIKDVYDNTGSTDANRNVSMAMQTFEPAPYDFDARMGTYPYYRSPWYRNTGIRNRVSLARTTIDSVEYFDMTALPRMLTNPQKLITDFEDVIINEAGLETAFEGNRWSDLLRIALRRKSTDPNYLANRIGAKFDAANNSESIGADVKLKLANPDNWYLPFRWK